VLPREPDATSASTAPKAGATAAPQESGANFDRWNRGAWIFRDETLRKIEILLDEAFPIPGTRIRFGLDAIVGLVPGIGDVLAGLASLLIPLAAWIRGAPYVTLVRMAANLGIGVLVGSIPIIGTSSMSHGRPTAATIACSRATWASLENTLVATGPSFSSWPPFSDSSLPSPWCWWCG
jgi:hypothetical protein